MARDLEIEVDAIDTIQLIPGSDPLHIPEGVGLFEAQFDRVGQDLVLSEQGAPVLSVPGFFLSATPVDLVAANGAVLSGELAARLAGSSLGAQQAQFGGGDAPVAIGQVETSSGLSTVQRADGSVEELAVGVKIFQNDIISTTADGKVSVTFSDGTIFSLAQSSRMVIDTLVYDPQGSENSGGFSLLTGGFVFIAGQVAKTGDMEVNTPSATLGIRGTTVQVDIELVGGIATVNVALNRDPDGGLGRIEMTDLDGNLIAVITSTDTQWVISPVEGQTREVERITTDQASDTGLLADAFAAFQSAVRRVEAGETFVELGTTTETGTPDSAPVENTEPAPVPNVDGTDASGDDPLQAPVVTPPSGGNGDSAPPPTEGIGDQGNLIEERPAPTVVPTAANNIQVAGVEDLPGGDPISGVLTVSQGDTGTLSFALLAEPSNGTAVVNPDGTFTYEPTENFAGTDTFTYEVSQGAGTAASVGTVTVNVAAVNDAPAVENLDYTATEDGGVIRTLTATDIEGDSLTFAIVQGEGPSNGSAVLLEDGSFSYVPNPDFNGSDSITYSVDDGNGGTATATISLTVTSVNDLPVAGDDTETTDEDTAISVDVLALASDVEDAAGSLTLESVQGASNGTVTIVAGEAQYTPNSDFFGEDSFTYTVSDTDGGTATGTISVTVSSVNDLPVAGDATQTTDEDAAISVDVLALASDVEDAAGSLTLVSVQGAGNGTVTIVAGEAQYTPNSDFFGEDSFTYTVSDTDGGTATGTISVTVSSVNDLPVAGDDTETTNEDTAILVDVLALASDVEDAAGSLTLESVQGASNGTVTIVAGEAQYTPNSDFFGEDSFTYTVSDTDGGTATGTISVTVSSVNDLPVAGDDTETTNEDTAILVDVLALASDVEDAAGSLTLESVQGASNGTVTIVAGEAQYTPNSDFFGEDSFTYTVSDTDGGTATGTISVTVTSVNDLPVAGDDTETTNEDTAILVDVLALASDVEDAAGSLTLVSVQGASNGTVTIVAGEAQYTPNSDFFGEDSFTYTVSDTDGGTATGTISVTVSSVNDLPVAGDDTETTNEDTAILVDVLALASDVEDAAGSLTLESVQGASNGTVTIVAGEAQYTPNSDFFGEDSFTYTVSDTDGGTATGTISVTVTSVNDLPVAGDATQTTNEDTAITVDVLALASDVEDAAGSLTLVSVQGAGNGTVTIVAGEAQYTPNSDFFGEDSFTYTVSDTDGGTATGTISVTVSSVNDLPVAGDDTETTNEDTAILVDVLALASDVEDAAGSLTLESVQGASNGTVTIVAGEAQYTPNSDFFGEDSFTYTVSDTDGGTATGTISVTVSSVNDLPVAGDDTETTNEDTAILVDVLALASDVEDAAGSLTLVSVQGASNGTVTIVAGEAQYTPNSDFFGEDSFTYTVSDTDGGTATGTISVTVSSVNDAPVFAPSVFPALSVTEDGTLTTGFDLNGSNEFSDLFIYLGGSDAAVEGEWRWTGGPEAGDLFWQGGVNGAAPNGGFAPWDPNGEPSNSGGTENFLMMYVNDGPIGLWNDINGALNPSIGFLVEMDAAPTELTGFVENPENGHFYKFFEDDVTWQEASGLAEDMGGYLATITSADERAFVLDLANTVTPYASDLEGDDLSFAVLGGGVGTYGTASIDENGAFVYELNNTAPNVQALSASQTVTDVFTVQVSDGNGGTATTSISVSVDGAYDELTPNNDLFILRGDTQLTPFTLDVLANDIGEGSLSISEYGYNYGYYYGGEGGYYEGGYYEGGYYEGGYYGSEGGYYQIGAGHTNNFYDALSLTPEQTLTYLPTNAFFGVDGFSYSAEDENGVSGLVESTVVVLDDDALTLSVLDGFTADLSEDLSSANSVMFGIDFTPYNLDFEVGQSGEFGALDNSNELTESRFTGLYGTASVTSEGDWSYELHDDTSAVQAALALSENGRVQEQFDLRITDSNDASAVTTLTANILEGSILEPIVAGPDAFVVARDVYFAAESGYTFEDVNLEIDILANDRAGSDFTLTEYGYYYQGYYWTRDSDFGNLAGNVEENGDGTFTFTRAETLNGDGFVTYSDDYLDYLAVANFEYTIEDEFGYTSTGTVHIAVVEDQSDLLGENVAAPLISLVKDADVATPEGQVTVTTGSSFLGTMTGLTVRMIVDGEYFPDDVFVASSENLPEVSSNPNFETTLMALGIQIASLGENNQFFVTATYDVPDGGGGSGTVQYSVTEVVELSKADSSQVVAGSTGQDLIFGSDLADTISGGDDDDVILGFFGQDSLTGGAGDDVLIYGGTSAAALEGGTGRDELRLLFNDSGPVDIAGLNASSIEVLDLQNEIGGQEITMTTADLIALFGGGDLELNALIDAENPTFDYDPTQTILVLGDASDSIEVDVIDGDQAFQQQFLSVSEGEDDFDIWQVIDTGSGDILATLGIDTDMTVIGQAIS